MFQPIKERKAWGYVTHIFSSPHAAVSLLEVEEGYRCSKHKHEHRNNIFSVLEGAIVVEQWSYVTGEKEMTLLQPGDTHEVRVPYWHRFRVVGSGKVVEVYYPSRPHSSYAVSLDDIIREDVGGPDDLEELKKELQEAEIEWKT